MVETWKGREQAATAAAASAGASKDHPWSRKLTGSGANFNLFFDLLFVFFDMRRCPRSLLFRRIEVEMGIRYTSRMPVSARRWPELTVRQWAKLGAYESPFSGKGMEFLPLGVAPPDATLLLHEAGYWPHHPHWNYPNVFSPFWRLYWDPRPGHRVVFKHTEVALGPDRIVLIPDHELFDTVGTEPRPKFWIHFSYAHRLAPDQTIPVELRPTPAELRLTQDLVKLLHPSRHTQDERRVYHCGLALLHLVLSRPEIRWQSEPPGKLAEAVGYIEQNYAAPIYTAELARLVNMSETLFRRKFRQFRSVSSAQFIAQTRVRHAAHLLAETPLSSSEIAERCGLTNATYFGRVFKKITGRPPIQFRHQVLLG
jgi:AraC-like DNA-binding protein